ncbi:MAG: tryptophan 7-halogenase [Proteobacteria bacterium]|nr:MAG: tryptophan 7-halogenase [Pseudomonadota bacterium]
MVNHPIQHIVIVGGGTAGWLTANVIAARFRPEQGLGVRVTLVESPNVPTIGVGEGTWPSMRTTLKDIGISEADFIRSCDASFKQGTWFKDWIHKGDSCYYHPFSLPEGFDTVNLAEHWLAGEAGEISFAEAVTPQYAACELGKAPKQIGIPNYAYTVNYGYHLDAGKFASLLTKNATEKLGVTHISADVVSVNSDNDGYITSVMTEQSGEIYGDLFVDCSGFQSLLLGQHFGVENVSIDQYLFNNAAVAVQVPYAEEDAPIATTTHSTAQENGWIWDIGLQHRRGVGHVFSKAFQTHDQTLQVLDTYLKETGHTTGLDDLAPRLLEFEPGYKRHFWVKNCLGIGLSAGFIEPLEASALVLVELSATALANQMPRHRGDMEVISGRFNREFASRWSQIIDFLKLHYVLSKRDDSAYWQENREGDSIPDSLKENLVVWANRPPWYHDDLRRDEMFPAASYQYVLYGMGFESQPAFMATRTGDQQREVARRLFAETQKKAGKYGQFLPPNRFLMNQLRDQDFARI